MIAIIIFGLAVCSLVMVFVAAFVGSGGERGFENVSLKPIAVAATMFLAAAVAKYIFG